MLRGVMVADDPGVFGAGTDERHVPAQHVPELRQLVDLESSQEVPEREHARVVRSGDRARRRPLLDAHGAELVHDERLAAPADARGEVEDRAPTLEPHADRGDEQQGRQ